MDVQRDDQATGLMWWVAIGGRVFPRLECVARRPRTAAGATLGGRYAGNAKRATARPTAERRRAACRAVTLTVVEGGHQAYRPLTALSPLQERIVEILGGSLQVSTRLCTISDEPPEKWANRKPKCFLGVIPAAQHRAISKLARKTNHIERFNNPLRQRVSGLVRKALSFSKKLVNHSGQVSSRSTTTPVCRDEWV
jgi:hypothetical protein